MWSVLLKKDTSEVGNHIWLVPWLQIFVCAPLIPLHQKAYNKVCVCLYAAIFMAISATRPRADVAYCIHALARRLSRTHNWAVRILFHLLLAGIFL